MTEKKSMHGKNMEFDGKYHEIVIRDASLDAIISLIFLAHFTHSLVLRNTILIFHQSISNIFFFSRKQHISQLLLQHFYLFVSFIQHYMAKGRKAERKTSVNGYRNLTFIILSAWIFVIFCKNPGGYRAQILSESQIITVYC